MAEITNLTTIDRSGNSWEFDVTVQDIIEKDIEGNDVKGKEFWIFKNLKKLPFIFQILFVSNNRIMILYIENQNEETVVNKGITKAMTKKILEFYKKDVISSSNNEDQKIISWEGRVGNVNQTWNKWCGENQEVSFISEENRFIWRYNQG